MPRRGADAVAGDWDRAEIAHNDDGVVFKIAFALEAEHVVDSVVGFNPGKASTIGFIDMQGGFGPIDMV